MIEPNALRFATSQKSHYLSIHELNLFQIQNDAAGLSFGFEEVLKLCHFSRPDSTTQGKGHGLPFRRYLNSQRHRFFLETSIHPGYNATRMPTVSH